jgi:2-haloacid dehalogenase
MMTDIEMLKREVKVLVFDQYGTVVDMQGGLTEVVVAYFKEKNVDIDPNRFVTWWRRTHFENSMIDSLCNRGHTPYREIGHRAVDYTLERSGIPHTSEEVQYLVGEIEKLRPFPEVQAALETLHTKYKLAILSNGDRDMLEAAKPYIDYRFDEIISVQEAGYFKPHYRTYERASEILDVSRSSILFVANHQFDCTGAKAFGMRTAFIDRRSRPFGQTPHTPDITVRDMGELAALIA